MIISFLGSLIVFSPFCISGTVPEGGFCRMGSRNECDRQTFCANSTCVRRLCRRDEFPSGFLSGTKFPPKCPNSYFCPGDGSGCQARLATGTQCEWGQDGQCAVIDGKQSLCVGSVCRYKDGGLGQSCIIDNETVTPTFSQHLTLYFRDTCQSPMLYCDISTLVCLRASAIGGVCQEDRECESYFCGPNGYCIEAPTPLLKLEWWKTSFVLLSFFSVITTGCIWLSCIKKKNDMETRKKLRMVLGEQKRNAHVELRV